MNKMKKFVFLAQVLAMTLAGISGWSQSLDTSGLGNTWKQLYNSTTSWEDGAFNANQLGHPDYGWGVYNSLTHDLKADSFYIISLPDGQFKKLWIVEKLSSQNIYRFSYGNLDGSEGRSVELNCNDYISKNFIHYSLAENTVRDIEPESGQWDLLLTKFRHPGLDYIVTGFLLNEGVSACTHHAPDSLSAVNAALSDTTEFTDSIAAIGNSWYELQGMSIVPLDTMAYFVKDREGDIYKMQVTWFESGFSGSGRVGIRTRLMGDEPGGVREDTLVMGAGYADEVYYSLAGEEHYQANRTNWEIEFKTPVFSASIRANIAAGVALYTYPNSGTEGWGSSSVPAGDAEPEHGLNVYPSPASEDVFLSWDRPPGEAFTVDLIDMAGRKIQEHRFRSSDLPAQVLRLDVSGLHPGVYLVRIAGNAGVMESKFIRK